LAEVTAARYNPNYGPQSDFEGHARDGPQRRQKGREKGSEEARRVPHSRAAEPNRAKSSKGSVGENRKEKQKVLNYGTNRLDYDKCCYDDDDNGSY
jgi:hypothetical protein